MLKFCIMYPKTPDGRFDIDYYRNKHLPMVKDKLGSICIGTSADDCIEGLAPGSAPQFSAIGYVYLGLDNPEDFRRLYAPHAEEIRNDIPNFTNIRPTAMFVKP